MSIPTSMPLHYSDYLAGAAIVTGIIGASVFVANLQPNGSEIVGLAGLLTTAFVALSQWLQSKGD